MKKVLLILFLIPAIGFSQNKLDNAKKKLKNESTTTKSTSSNTKKSNKRNSRRNSSASSIDYDSSLESVLLQIGFRITAGVVFGEVQKRDLNPYPYFYDDEGEYAGELSKTGRKQSFRLSGNYLFNTIKGAEINALYKPLPILGFELSRVNFAEQNIKNKDYLNISSFMANYYRLREKNIALWWGIGISYVGSGVNTLGFSYNLGTDIYPVKPISIHLSWKESFINGNDIGLFKSQLKYHIKKKA